MKNNLSINIVEVSKKLDFQNTVLTILLSLGIVGTVTPFLVKQLDRDSKAALLIAGSMSNLTASLLPRNTKIEKLKKFHDQTINDNYANQLRHEVVRENAVIEIRERNKLAKYIDNDVTVPDFQKGYWANKFGVTQLITSFFVNQEVEEDEEIETSHTLPDSVLSSQLKQVAQTHDLNLDWITKIVPQSKVIVGGRGSGKSRFMRYILADYVLSYPNDEWFVIDPHYEGYEEEFDKNNPDQAWLLGVDSAKLKERIVDNVENGYIRLMDVYKIFKERIKTKNKYPKVPRIMVFVDEFEAFKKGLTDEQFENLLEFIEVAQDEGRKFGVELTIGMHSLKKERTGIDSTVISQMYWVLLENTATDRNTVFPADFDQKAIIRQLKKINQNKDRNKYRAFVLTSPTGDLLIDLLPLLSLPTFQQNQPITSNQDLTPEQEAFLTLKNWVGSMSQLPTHLQVWQKWEELTGQKLNEKGLLYLLEKLNLV